MTAKEMNITSGRMGAALNVHVKPSASKDRIARINADGSLALELACETDAAQVNDRTIQFFAKLLDVPVNNIEIVAGERGVKKIVSILDVSSEYVNQKILQAYR